MAVLNKLIIAKTQNIFSLIAELFHFIKYALNKPDWINGWLVGYVLWHINSFRLFNAKYIYLHICKYILIIISRYTLDIYI